MKGLFVIMFFLLQCTSVLYSEEYFALPDSNQQSEHITKIDTARLLSDIPVKSPTGAVLRSAVLPGWGQFYNEQYLKGIFVFTLNGALLATILYYDQKWEDTGNEAYRERRNLFTWFLAGAYLLTLLDAYVDAYLFGFSDAINIAAIPKLDDSKNWKLDLNLKIRL